MEYCLKYSDRLYEKYTKTVNRKTQSKAWDELALALEEVEEIRFESTSKLKSNVTNWVRRATVGTFLKFHYNIPYIMF